MIFCVASRAPPSEFMTLEPDLEGGVGSGLKVPGVFKELRVVCVVAQGVWRHNLLEVK